MTEIRGNYYIRASVWAEGETHPNQFGRADFTSIGVGYMLPSGKHGPVIKRFRCVNCRKWIDEAIAKARVWIDALEKGSGTTEKDG